MLQKCIFCFAFLKFGKLEMVFSEARFLYLDERKKQPLINLREEPWKLFGNENQHGWNLEILHQAFYVHLHKRKLLSLSFGLFFAEILLSLLLDNIHIMHTLSHKCLKSFDFTTVNYGFIMQSVLTRRNRTVRFWDL